MATYYLRVEAVNLANFITDTEDLSTIRGGGLLLLEAVDRIPHEAARDLQTLTTGASAGLYRFEAPDDEGAQALRDRIAGWLKGDEALGQATFVVDYQSAGPDGRFADDFARLLARNRWRQMQSPTVIFDQDSSDHVCDIDFVRPATHETRGPERELRVSESVYRRRSAGRELKQKFYRRETGKVTNAEFVREFNELAVNESKGNLNGKMAVIYLDGNSFGRIKSCSHDRQSWLAFDTTVKEYRKQMLGGLLDLMARDADWQVRGEHGETRYRIETLLWGGDEILWVVPAWKAWEALAYFYQSSVAWKFGEHPLRHAGGLIFCHCKAPIHRMVRLAKQLADLAKEVDRGQNLFAYEVLESFDHVGSDLEEYRRRMSPQPLEPPSDPHPRSLILRGEDMPEIAKIVSKMREGVPRKRLYDLASELLSPPRADDGLADRVRLRKELASRLEASIGAAGVSAEAIASLAETKGGKDAVWVHLNALWDYLPDEKEVGNA